MNEWSKMIRDLSLIRFSYKKIGSAIGCSASTIGDLATGRSQEPRAGLAMKLTALHRSKAKAITAAKAAKESA